MIKTFNHSTVCAEITQIHDFLINNPDPARGFGYTISGALLIPLYSIFLSHFRYISWISHIQFIDMN